MLSVLYLSACLVGCFPQPNTISPAVSPIDSPAVISASPTLKPTPSRATPTVRNTATLMSEITLSNTDNGKALTLKPGQKIKLRLNENPTTGYRWSIPALNSQILQLTDDRFDLPNTSAIGGGGQRILTFQAHQLGQITLNLKNRREWEDQAAALESFNLTIQVVE